MPHVDHHPVPVDGCFGCKVSSLGFQSLSSRAGGRRSDPTQVRDVVADDGPSRGQVVGEQRDHWDGRLDATVFAPTHKISTQTAEER